ncbi:hypothetical protein BZL30_3370 [Mycobacterium kansasii]|uniref:Uncharacterized protein n=1 Tax=Mycobacterium kansasii TaxID=1768 RepID=A0A1V3XAB5_MYCKA|nr:hypothetical protein BZL30_3370 [Mycobacterium kansasii]
MRWRLRSRDDGGSATVLAVAMVGVLLWVTGRAPIWARWRWLGIVRRRSPIWPRWRRPRGYRMAARWLARGNGRGAGDGVGDAGCAVRDLDVVVTVEVPVAFAGVARAAARAGRPAASESQCGADC